MYVSFIETESNWAFVRRYSRRRSYALEEWKVRDSVVVFLQKKWWCVIYQTQETKFYHISKQWEESGKYNVQQGIFDEP